MATSLERQVMAHAMDLLVANRGRVRYLQRRPMGTRNVQWLSELVSLLHGPGIDVDCSESAHLIAHVAGLENPSGFTWGSGAGNTQTMFDHLPHYTNPRGAGIGAFCFLGVPGRLETQHVCVVRRPGVDPLLFSHGGPGAGQAHWIPFSVERRYHLGTPVFLNISHL